MNTGGNEILIIIIIALVLFGGSQLPKIARNLGSAQKEFKKGLAESKADDEAEAAKKKAEEEAKSKES
ncbi:MAG TPA: twin-arginine translocase TatA/TatE family subunit [Microthrixaceae bacterium]|nr:twin-arginine translocase TatA/TatE family subunit [Microthrixaceae bacterium]